MRALVLLVASCCAGGLGCGQPQVGDSCATNSDCVGSQDQVPAPVCDTAQLGGYCTVTSCTPNSCPDNAACVFFDTAGTTCPYPPATGSSECMRVCKSGSDCRDGYVCSSPQSAPWSATILDGDKTKLVCIAPVESMPMIDASLCQTDASPSDSGMDGLQSDAGPVDGSRND
jgi:hypothetical protein